MEKWEYTFLNDFGDSSSQKILTEFGDSGWEAFSVVPLPIGNNTIFRIYFKRKKNE